MLKSVHTPFKVFGLLIAVIGLGMVIYFNYPRSVSRHSDLEYRNIWDTAFKRYGADKKEGVINCVDSMYTRLGKVSPYGMFLRKIHVSFMFYKEGYFDKAVEYADSAVSILESSGLADSHTVDYIHSLLSLGDALYAAHKYTQAYDIYYKARSIVQKTANQCLLNEYSYALGMVLYSQKKYREAAWQFQASFIEASQCVDTLQPIYRMQEVLSNAALCYTRANISDSALFYYDSAISYISKNAKRFGDPLLAEKAIGVVYGNMATIYFNNRRMDTAETLLKKSIAINVKPGYENTDAQKTKLKLARLYFEESEFGQMLHTLEDLRRSMDTIHDIEAEQDWQKLMYQFYDHNSQVPLAYGHYRRYIELRDSLEETDRKKIQSDILGELKDKDQQSQIGLLQKNKEINRIYLIVTIAFSLLAVIIIVLVFANYRRSKKQAALLEKEKKISEDLLLNILPAEVADELKSKGSAAAKNFDNVTVLFTDFVNFSGAGEQMTAQELVNELDICFKEFDNIIGKYNIEKIKTIGDAYLAISGLPLPDEHHAEKIVLAAIEMNDFMQQRYKQLDSKTFLMRIGIHSGSVVAGIVGLKKFAYDIWGDTVNVAARMEQNSEPGRINISQTTYDLVKEKFICTHRGEIEAKNKGRLNMYFVEGVSEVYT